MLTMQPNLQHSYLSVRCQAVDKRQFAQKIGIYNNVALLEQHAQWVFVANIKSVEVMPDEISAHSLHLILRPVTNKNGNHPPLGATAGR